MTDLATRPDAAAYTATLRTGAAKASTTLESAATYWGNVADIVTGGHLRKALLQLGMRDDEANALSRGVGRSLAEARDALASASSAMHAITVDIEQMHDEVTDTRRACGLSTVLSIPTGA